MRRAAKIDSNQKTIVEAFRNSGASVAHTHGVGSGFPDVVVGVSGHNLLIEIKDGNKPPSKRKLTADEQKWHDDWLGNVHIVENEEQAIELVNKIRSAGL